MPFFDDVWDKIAHLFKNLKNRPGRPPKHSFKNIVEAILHVLREGCRWSSLPSHFPPKSTVHQCFKKWQQGGVWEKVFEKIIKFAEVKKSFDLNRGYIDATFLRSKNGSDNIGPTKCGKGHKLMALVDGNGLPIAIHLGSASPHEISLVENTLRACKTEYLPSKVFGDKAYDSDEHDKYF